MKVRIGTLQAEQTFKTLLTGKEGAVEDAGVGGRILGVPVWLMSTTGFSAPVERKRLHPDVLVDVEPTH